MCKDVKLIIVSYLTDLYYKDVLCELKQRMLHKRLMKEIFKNAWHIHYRFVDPLPIVDKLKFFTSGEIHMLFTGVGDDSYMANYDYRFDLFP